jgi:tRNA pseudouridine55 synthase
VVARVRRVFKTREVGHAGTLDPMATGVLVLALGEATKLVPYLTNAAKEYGARLQLGQETDTLDAMGKVVAEHVPDDELVRLLERGVSPLPARIATAIAQERARTSQDPPIYSAIQQDGERAYAKARRGEEVILEARAVHVHTLEITAAGTTPAPWLDVRVKADKGYYVRSLGRDLSHALGTVGHLIALRRVDSGGFSIADALPLSAAPEALKSHLIPLDVAARRALPSATLTDAGVIDARFGKRVSLEGFEGDVPRGSPSAWLDRAGQLVAVGIIGDDGQVLRGFNPPAS